MSKQQLTYVVGACILCSVVSWWAATSDYSPIKPLPTRPVLRLLARLARTGLWVMMFAEPAPQADQQHLVHARVDGDGHQILDHGRGW